MAAVTIRKLPDEAHAALKRRAKMNGRSTEAEIRDILMKEVGLAPSKGLGTQLYELGRRFGGVDIELPPRTGMATAHDFDDDNT